MNVLRVKLSVLSCLMALAAVTYSFFAEPASAQQRIRITEGQVAPTPIAIAEFTNLDGEISDSGRQIAEIISNAGARTDITDSRTGLYQRLAVARREDALSDLAAHAAQHARRGASGQHQHQRQYHQQH